MLHTTDGQYRTCVSQRSGSQAALCIYREADEQLFLGLECATQQHDEFGQYEWNLDVIFPEDYRACLFMFCRDETKV